ncbi:MAG: aminotransferase class V-fold PLP-dependent enzyme [Pseudobdellovibrio sp.]
MDKIAQHNNLELKKNYTRQVLLQTENFELVSCEWLAGSKSDLHSHGFTQCHILVQEGEFTNVLKSAHNSQSKVYRVGEVISVYSGVQHQIECSSITGKTFHVYTPKLIDDVETNISNNFAPVDPQKIHSLIDISLKNHGVSFQDLIQITEVVKSLSVKTDSIHFMNQLFSGVHPESLLADQVIAQTRTTAATYEASPVFTTIELEVIKKLGELIGWNTESCDGITVAGGSAANFMALHCARHRHNPNYKQTGMAGAQYKIFVSKEAHYSFQKACVAMGFGLDSLVLVDADQNGKMNPAHLQELILISIKQKQTPLLVCATAGTTVLGAFDPIQVMSEICKKHNIWLHIDGAWGGPILFSERRNTLLAGIENCDSMTFDAHKLLGATLACSFFLTQHQGLLFDANNVSGGAYLFHEDNETPDLGRQSWQCGRRPDAFSFWLMWKSQGSEGFKKLIDHLYSVQTESVAWIKKQAHLTLVNEPEFFNLCVRVKNPNRQDDNTWSTEVRNRLKSENKTMMNFSTNQDGSFLRLILANPQIETEHVKNILTAALEMH